MKEAVFILSICFTSLVLGQAPDDFHIICRTSFQYRMPHDWIPYVNDTAVGVRGDVKWQVLLDQYDYQHILGESNIPAGVWMRTDIDGDNVQFDQSSTICTNRLLLRDTYLQSDSNNWVFTQSVSYLDAVQVIVNATVRFTGCQERSSLNPPCQNNFVILHRYDANSSRTTTEITNVANYQPCFGDLMSSRLEQTGDGAVNVINKFDRPKFNLTYFGIQDIGTYGDVQRVLVYYRVAQGYEQGLVRCPSVALPGENSKEIVSRSCTCMDNAMSLTTLERKCRGNGICEENPVCGCSPGYQYNDTQRICQACPVGTYKASVSNTTRCTPCPANSTAVNEATTVCECDCGTTRNPSRPENPCQKPLCVAGAVAITFFFTLIPSVIITALTVILIMWCLCVKHDRAAKDYHSHSSHSLKSDKKDLDNSANKSVDRVEPYKRRPTPNYAPKPPPARPKAPPRPL